MNLQTCGIDKLYVIRSGCWLHSELECDLLLDLTTRLINTTAVRLLIN